MAAPVEDPDFRADPQPEDTAEVRRFVRRQVDETIAGRQAGDVESGVHGPRLYPRQDLRR